MAALADEQRPRATDAVTIERPPICMLSVPVTVVSSAAVTKSVSLEDHVGGIPGAPKAWSADALIPLPRLGGSTSFGPAAGTTLRDEGGSNSALLRVGHDGRAPESRSRPACNVDGNVRQTRPVR